MYMFSPEKAQETQTKPELTRTRVSVYADAHSLPAPCDSLHYHDSQMILCNTFFTCDNLLFWKDEAEFHFLSLAILQPGRLSEARGLGLPFTLSAFLSFNTAIKVQKLCNLISFQES